MPYFPNKPGVELVADQLSDITGLVFSASDLSVGVPAPSSLNGRNTAVPVEVLTGILRGSETTMHYDRLNLSILLGTRNPQIVDEGYLTTRELIDAINTAYGFALSETDFEDTLLEVEFYPHVVTLTAASDSLVVIGTSTVTLLEGSIPPNALLTEDGFVIETEENVPITIE